MILPEAIFKCVCFLISIADVAHGLQDCKDESDTHGLEYNGTISQTKSGITCQRWDANSPHKPNYRPENPPEHENFCRNPDSESDGPWCYTTNPQTRWEYCDVSKCSECIMDSDPLGVDYIGTVSYTRTGRKCQRWDVNLPHKTSYRPENASQQENYCRNPDEKSKAPWCYTTDPDKRWEYCSVRKCSDPGPPPPSCYVCKGEYYTGKLDKTKTGKTCQRWDRDFPHTQYYSSFYPELRKAENYCRNSDNSARPWCFTSDPGQRWDYCDLERCRNLDGTIKLAPEIPHTTECYEGNGHEYRGKVSQTRSGKTCMAWSSQSPHTHKNTPENFPCSGLEGNYCRNPFSSKQYTPWCYTTDPDVTWEFCDIPKCGTESEPREPIQERMTSSVFPPDPEGCSSCNGFNYYGKVNTTESGRTCQRWDSDEPHSHKNWTEWDMSENYCRSAGKELKPWCYTTDPNKRWEYCDIDRCTNPDGSLYVPAVEYTTECSFRRGETYRGKVSRTWSGRTCAKWGSHSPHTHHFNPKTFPCSGLEENYCRKPDTYFNAEAPWCYTTDPDVEWEHCNIPLCDPDGKPNKAKSTRPAQCGVSFFDPIFTSQHYKIENGRIVKTDDTGVRHLARIIGGEVVAHGTWPWMVTLKKNTGSFCGGSLIHESWVLTAAHCIKTKQHTEYIAIVGYHKRMGSRSQGRAIRRQFMHEEKMYWSANDVALLQLDSPVELNKYVQPICLPEPDEIVPPGTYCVAAGWGRTNDPNHTGGLKQVVLPVRDCNSVLFVCTGNKGVDENTCYGDSGGPIMCLDDRGRWINHGVASYIYGCSVKDGRAGFASTSKYIGWINRIMEMYG